MRANLELDQARAFVQGIDIPVRPVILQKISEIHSSQDPNIDEIAKLISGDVSLSASVLKTVNSPLYGLPRKISSIPHAVNLLGLNNVINLVIGLSLRLEIGGKFNVAVERFWDSASDVALISASIANQLSNVPQQDAYTLGLFHDCGIPLLMLKDPGYVELLKMANSSRERIFTDVENEHIKTDHTLVGFYVAKSWRIPMHICHCILNHHETDMLKSDDPLQNNLIANLKLAEAISHSVRRLSDHPEWERMCGEVLEFLQLSDQQFEEIKEDSIEKLGIAA